jgi:DNA-binding MarR family transcriptional regulator
MPPPSRARPSPTPSRPAAGSDLELARTVWSRMSELVRGHDPTDELRRSLGLGRGTGRVKALLSLAAGPLSLAELAQVIGVDPPYATLIANELQALGLLSRSADPEDRRRKSVQLTGAGTKAVRKAQQIIDRPPPPFRKMSRVDLRRLEDLLERLGPEPGEGAATDPAPALSFRRPPT